MKILAALLIAIFVAAAAIVYSRRRSIRGTEHRNKYFAHIARKLGWNVNQDSYFAQIEGEWKGMKCWIYPHNFEGPGSITLFYADTGIPLQERTWIEPALSLGRAIVDWKNGRSFGFETAGDRTFFNESLTDEVRKQQANFPFIAVTTSERFLYSPLLIQSLHDWPNFIVLLAMDTGRKPAPAAIQNALDVCYQIRALMHPATTGSSH